MKRVNIFTVLNGVGLEQDAMILKSIIKADIRIYDILKHPSPRQADVNIFLEIANQAYLHTARKNYLFPNPEWFDTRWLPILKRFDQVCCKTLDALRIFKSYTPNLIYTGFTSVDCYQKEQPVAGFLHVAGKSSTKNTEAVCQAYQGHKELPELYLLQHKNRTLKKELPNVTYVTERVQDGYFRKVQNSLRFHICASQYEGFGHYLNEARSVGAVIITTDAPPMNDFIDSDCGVLVPVSGQGKQHLGMLNFVSGNDMYKAIKRCAEMGQSEINEKSENARERFVNMDKYFKEVISQII